MRAYIIVDLGFGDAGKGLLTDFLVRQFEAGLVVRYNGSAQAGHNVLTPEGHHHTFSQFGSGTFIPNVKTYLSRHVVVHPTALLVEGDILKGKGVKDAFSRLRLSDQALVITPFHQAANRIREIVRATDRHGSCGVGVGETVEDALSHPEDRVLAGDLNNPDLLGRKLRLIREQKRAQLLAFCRDHSLGSLPAREGEVFEREDVIDTWISSVAKIAELGLVVSDSTLAQWLRETKDVIFEGAQGVLLDEDFGFHPYTTWSRCTTVTALDLIQELAPGSPTFQIGVMRSYAVRHGPGPLPTEMDALTSMIDEHNRYNAWQGEVRYGWFDAVLARYALHVMGKVDSLAVTHLDILPRLKAWKYCLGYKNQRGFENTFFDTDISNGVLTNFRLPTALSLEQREQFTQALSKVEPVFGNCDTTAGKVIPKIESLLGQPIGIVSRGPRAGDVQILNPIPRD